MHVGPQTAQHGHMAPSPRPRHIAFPVAAFLLLAACGEEAAQPDWWSSRDAGTDSTHDGAEAASDAIDESDATDEPEVPNLPPSAVLIATPEAGTAPLTITFDASESSDPDGTLTAFAWEFGDGSSGVGETTEHAFDAPGCYRVVLTVTDDAGATDTAETTVVATNGLPAGDPAVTFEALPLPMAVVPRDVTTGEGTVNIRGTVDAPGYHAVVVEVTRGETVVAMARAGLCSVSAQDPFDLSVGVPAELSDHEVSVYVEAGNERWLVQTVDKVVAGDVLIVQGQSNAVATQYAGDANVNASPFLRSFGARMEDGNATAADRQWRQAEGNLAEGPAAIGQWAMRMGRGLIEAHEVPIAILNGARGGRPISYFQRNDADPTDLATNYGRLLTRVRHAGLENGIRAILYYQGESDGANAAEHHDGWVALHEDWREDYPSVERTYVTQVRKGCGDPTPQLRDGQRRLADEVPNVGLMSTHGLDGHDGCHFAYANGYELLGQWYAALLTRDLYDGAAGPDIEAPNVDRIYFSKGDGTEVTIEMRDKASTMTFDAGAEAHFVVEGASVTVVSGSATGSSVVLTLSGDGLGATGLTYAGHEGAGPWVTNASGIGLLAFSGVPVEAM